MPYEKDGKTYCERCNEEVVECVAYVVSAGHRHSGHCNGYVSAADENRHECRPVET